MSNAISDQGAQCIGTSLEQNKTLQVLNLGHQFFSFFFSQGISEFNNQTARNDIHDEGANYIWEMLKVNKGLTDLDLGKFTFSYPIH